MMYLVASWLDVHIDFDFAHPFYCVPEAKKIGRVEVNLSSPAPTNNPLTKALEIISSQKNIFY